MVKRRNVLCQEAQEGDQEAQEGAREDQEGVQEAQWEDRECRHHRRHIDMADIIGDRMAEAV